MANSTEAVHHRTLAAQYLLLFGCLGIILAGLGTQSFIVAVNVIDWLKGRSMAGADQIITSIGISRIFIHISCLFYLLAMFLVSEIPQIFSILISFAVQSSSFSNIWLSTLLSIFYCMASTSSNVFFLRLKAFVLRRVTYLIYASVLVSLGYSSIYFLVNHIIFSRNSTHHPVVDYEQKLKIMAFISLLWSMAPLLMYFMASIFLIALLAYQMSRMNNHGNATGRADTYLRIVRFTLLSLMVFALNLLIIYDSFIGFLDILVFGILANVFPLLQSVLLIYVATKLRNQFLWDCLIKGKSSRTRPIEPERVTPL